MLLIQKEELQFKVKSLEDEIEPFRKKTISIENLKKKGIINETEDVLNGLASLSEKLDKILEIFDNNKILIKIGLAGAGTIPPVLMYNTTLNLFSRFALYPILDLKEKLSKEELYNEIKINKIIKHNRRIIRRFNIIAMPLLAGIYLNGLNRINEKLDSVEMTLGSNKETTTPTAPSAFQKEQSIIPLINLKKLE